MRTVLFSYVITDIVSTLVLVFLWQQNRKRFHGTSFWVLNFLFQTIALLLIISRGRIPDWFSMVFSNTLVISGALLGLIGLEKFLGKKSSHLHNYIVLAIYIIVHTYFTSIRPDLSLRTLNTSVAMLIICFQCFWLLLFGVSSDRRRMTMGVGMVFAAFSMVSLIRIFAFFFSNNPSDDFFHSGDFDVYIMISYQILFILLTYSLTLLFNKRLLGDILFQEEKFSKAFHTSPYAIMITGLEDGKIIDVNKGFMKISGYRYSEAIGKTTNDLNLWNTENDRSGFVNELSEKGIVDEKEYQFRSKNGKIIYGLTSAEVITINNEKSIIASINDISARKLAEEKVSQQYFTLKGLTDSSSGPIFSVDLNYCYTSFNKVHSSVMKSIYGSDIQIGRSFLEYITVEDDRLIAKANIDRALRGEQFYEEVSIGVESISRVCFEVTHNPIINDYSNIIGVAVMARDLTQRKKMEQELHEKISELEKFNKIMVGRENRMIELKKEINELCVKLELPLRYKSVDEKYIDNGSK